MVDRERLVGWAAVGERTKGRNVMSRDSERGKRRDGGHLWDERYAEC